MAHLLTTYNGKSITYDTIGNPLSDGTWSYTWQRGRQLATMAKSGTTWTFSYDANGMRTRRIVSTSSGTTTYTYTYSGSQLTHMTVGGYTLHFYYDANGYPMSVVYNGTTYYYATNLQGDVVAILNSSGVQVVGYRYDAWGRLLTTTGSMSGSLGYHNPLRYRGYVYDQETGLYYLQSRYYNPAMGRFINADDTAYLGADGSPQSYNLFVYCGNNPVMHSDPTGRFVITLSAIITAALIGAAVGVTAGAVAGAATAACNDTDIVSGLISGAIGGAILGAGAGVGALFLAPIITGGSVTLSIAGSTAALSAGAAIGTGLTIGGATGMIGGGLADMGNQLGNNGMQWSRVDYGSVAISAVEYGALNMVSTGLGSLMGPYLSNAMNFLGSKLLNVIPTGWGFTIDVIRGQS